jgi:hypothetical protein
LATPIHLAAGTRAMHPLQALARSTVFLLALGASSLVFALDPPVAATPAMDAAIETTGAAHWTSSYDVSKSDYRWSLGRGAFDVGLRLEPRSGSARSIESRLDVAAPLVPDLPSLSVGLRSTSIKGDGSASSLLDRALGSGGEAYVRKLGVEWKPAQSRLFLRQGLGIRLDGDDRLTMRLRKGSLGLYMQSNF